MHVNTFVVSFYNIFLRDLSKNFDRYYYEPVTTVFIIKNVLFSTYSSSTDKTKSMCINYACKYIRFNLL